MSPARRLLVVGGSLAGGALAFALAGGAALGVLVDYEDPQGGGADRDAQDTLRADLRALTDAGLPADDPKVSMLEEELAALEALETAVAEPDPGLDPEALRDLTEGSTRSDRPDPTEEWETGEVDCEPLPGRLTVDDLAGASCFVEHRADGSIRYVAVAPDGTERDALFADGD